MFTKLKTSQRIEVGLVLAMAFLLVLGTNLLDKRHFSNIQTTVNSVYRDRVVVQDYIYRLSSIFYIKKHELNLNDKLHTLQNEKVDQLLVDFENTQLTPDEKILLYKLKTQFVKLKDVEYRIANPSNKIESDLGIVANKTLDEMHQKLDALAAIQLSESKQMIQLSKKSLGTNIMLSKLELVFLILIGLAILFLIFNPSKKKVSHSDQ